MQEREQVKDTRGQTPQTTMAYSATRTQQLTKGTRRVKEEKA